MTDEKKDTFGERLRKVREALGLTRVKLAVLAKVSAVTIKSIEAGREGAGKSGVFPILCAIAKHDLKRARWIAESADAPPQALEALALGAVAPITPPPIAARILIDRRGLRKSISIWLDWVATAQLIEYAAWQELTNPDSRGLAITISLAVPDPPRSQN